MAGRRQTATMELAIGACIIAGIIILIVMLMAWGNTTSFLSKHYRVVVNMTNVGGLKEGAPVKIGGFQIGRVSTIGLRQGSTELEIVLDIDEARLIPKDSTAKVSTAGLVGDAFMEIIPGKSMAMLARAGTIADAERLESAPLPDLSELLAKVNEFGTELTKLTESLNDIIGDNEFRRSIKSLAVNIDAASHQANLILQRSQNVVGNVEIATQNIATLSGSLKDEIDKIVGNIEEVTVSVKDIAVDAKAAMTNISDGVTEAREAVTGISGDVRGALGDVRGLIADLGGDVKKTMNNIDGGVTDARSAINKTIGNPEVAANLATTIENITKISDGIAARREAISNLVDNIGDLAVDLKAVGGKVKDITDRIEPESVAQSVESINEAIQSMTDMVDKIKAEPVLALSVNKAADRIVKAKFDEMSRQPQFRSSDAMLDEINRWVRDAMRRGTFVDPSYNRGQRPYLMGQ